MFKQEIEKFLKEDSLYDGLKINKSNFELLEEMFGNEIVIDTYCTSCKKESTFKGRLAHNNLITKYGLSIKGVNNKFDGVLERSEEELTEDDRVDYNIEHFWNNVAPIILQFTCQRDPDHKMYFMLLFRNSALIKIGQYPSTATIDNADLQRYRKILDEDKYKEFSKGVGLASHGVGIGSFVYLRRIFEGLIEESHLNAKKEITGWNEEEYKQCRMNDKIKLLKGYLPAFLVEHSELYGILSKGVHELEEDKCLEMFPNIQLAIEIILDEKIAEREKESKIKKASRFIKETHANFK
ncbi:hypothetical protein [Pontibacillus yanchengensis]|uniref:Uncharacterized protein n=1 Tax=Pontibacillus yanchengensis Y32 TaxID=1385514 RepID=A0A0A2T7K5_9BACI|nr:hypothetical protein [Pontibacillus yanchengensis]KGP71509.1 hypothetical protein N782_18455 [Pontibacillus yanchengensis Y32]